MSKSNEILIYVSELNNRIHFLFRHVFSKMVSIRPTFTNDKEAFVKCTTPKLNYSPHRFVDELHIKPHGLLYQKGVKKINLNGKEIDGNLIRFSMMKAKNEVVVIME